MKKIVISMLGSVLDSRGFGQKRFESWRPNYSFAQMEELAIDQLELIYHPQFSRLATFVKQDIEAYRPEMQVNLHIMETNDAWDFEQIYTKLLDFSTHYPFDNTNEYYIHITTGTHVMQICLYLLTEAHYLQGKLIQTAPPNKDKIIFDRLGHRIGEYQIIDLDLSKYDLIAARFHKESQITTAFLKGGILTNNARFNTTIDQIEAVALKSIHPILLTGATGTGKTQLAKRIYQLKKNKGLVAGDLIEVNCAVLRGDHAMSTLFGHIKGSYTGAVKDRNGLLKNADKGVLFLDEIGDLGLDEQTMLLRALEDKIFMPLGADYWVNSDFQLIAGTNKDLHQQVEKGLFREDLLARINLWHYELPNLRSRAEDLAPNIEFELTQYAQIFNKKIRFVDSAKQDYLSFAQSEAALWRSNFRDLNASIIRMATLAENGLITKAVVKQEIERLQKNWQIFNQNSANNFQHKSHNTVQKWQEWQKYEWFADLDLFDQSQLAQVLNVCQASKTLAEAGRKLFNHSRAQKKSSNDSHRLKIYLAKFGLEFNAIKALY